ncbi:MAG: T9SS type A sorting domain-containing protein [Calditrichaeota bacterium]|nr:T9SS type A sorting domain-containing protein [Calditrichota bacterium]MCB9391803.1 T9SS type A sorting domain-containing protein [Calditrichota bacterium]
MFRFKKVVLLMAVLAFGITQAWATMVTFQVDMSVQVALGNFTPGTDMLVVRGSFNGWGGNDNELTLSGDVYTTVADIAAGAIEYKFVMVQPGQDVWESVDNRTADISGDTQVIPVVFFNNIESSESADVEVNFRVNMTVQDLSGTFDPDADWVVVRGNHGNLGNWGGAVQLIEETGNPGIYSLRIQFDGLPQNAPVEYKFVILAGGDPNAASWESSANRSFTPTGDEPDNLPPPSGNGYGEINPELVYFANITPDDIITNDVDVIFQVEATPLEGRLTDLGYVYDVQTGDTIFSVESIQAAGFFNNWPWGNFDPAHTLNDNGTNGDMTAGDDIWSVTIPFAAGAPRALIYKYGANQLDVEAGFALNHERTIDDSQPTYRMDIDCWGSPDTLYQNWDCMISGAADPHAPIISEFTLEQNFPNPFNPTTTINFTLSRADVTSLKVFDILGRNVADLSFGRMDAGRHTVSFDGSNLSSGVYFYTLASGVENATRKMLLLK